VGRPFSCSCPEGSGVFHLGLGRDAGAVVRAFGVFIAVDQLDHGERRVVAMAETGFEDAGVAALAILVALSERVEELHDHIIFLELGSGETTVRKTAFLAERDQLLDDGLELLRLGQGRGDLLVADQRDRSL
jgi:hypothetical protein